MSQEPPANDHPSRLLQGLAQAVAAKGYADTTIADIVREAGVSRRTFYEHFDGKPAALIALYESASLRGLRVLQDAIDPARDWQTQVDQALGAYLGSLAQNPVLLRTLFVEILGLGVTGLAARRRVHDFMADFMLEVINAGQSPARLQRPTAVAVIGGIHELVLQALEQDRAAALPELAGVAGRLLRAAVQAPAS
jgi:AcrR family transcriptional regulator